MSLSCTRQSSKDRFWLWMRRARNLYLQSLSWFTWALTQLTDEGKLKNFPCSCSSHKHTSLYNWSIFKVYLSNIVSYMTKQNTGTRAVKGSSLFHEKLNIYLQIQPTSFTPVEMNGNHRKTSTWITGNCFGPGLAELQKQSLSYNHTKTGKWHDFFFCSIVLSKI